MGIILKKEFVTRVQGRKLKGRKVATKAVTE